MTILHWKCGFVYISTGSKKLWIPSQLINLRVEQGRFLRTLATDQKRAFPASQKILDKKCLAPKHWQAYEQGFGLLQHRAIHNAEQQQAHELDLKTDYVEYPILWAQVRVASQRLTEVRMEIKRLQWGTPKHKMLEDDRPGVKKKDSRNSCQIIGKTSIAVRLSWSWVCSWEFTEKSHQTLESPEKQLQNCIISS